MKLPSLSLRMAHVARALLAAAGLANGSTTAQDLALPIHVIAGGGGTSVSGSTTLSGTAGLPIVGVSQAQGTVIRSGFWLSPFPGAPKAGQSISFPPIADQDYAQRWFKLDAFANSGLPITFTSSDPSIVEISGNHFRPLTVGQVTITASQPGNEAYEPAPTVSRTCTILPAEPLLTWYYSWPIPYGTPIADFDLNTTAVVEDDLGVRILPGQFTYSPGLGVVLDVGLHVLTAQFVPEDSVLYRPASITRELEVVPAPQRIVFSNIAEKTYGDAPFTLDATGGPSGAPVIFTSDTPGVIVISGNLATVRGAGTAVITATQAGTSNYLPAQPVTRTVTVRPAEVTVRAEDQSMAAGQSLPPLTYQVSGLAYDDTDAVFNPPVKLTTSATPASAPGDYPIVPSDAAAQNYHVVFAPGTLTIRPAEPVAITVTPATASLAAGLTQAFTATGTYTDGTIRNLTATASWTSDQPGVASVDHTGLARALSAGSTVIRAAQQGVSGSATLTVTDATLVSIAVTPGTASIAAGLTQKFQATGTYTDGSTRDLTAAAAWTSSNTSVATIGGTGLATGVTVGNVTISAVLTGVTATATLSVTSPTLVALTVLPATATIVLGQSQAFTATGTFSDGSTQDLTTKATWTSSNPGVASINSSGIATGIAAGNATITATRSNRSGTASLAVTGVPTATRFANAAALAIPLSGPASLYPSTITVSGLSGSIARISAQVQGLTHAKPDDLDILLVGPAGQKVLLQSDCGDSLGVADVTVTYDDTAPAPLPNSARIATGSYRPTNYGGGDRFPAPAPAAPYASALSAFNGTNPNGAWSLFVLDDQSRNQGSISRGWSLTITTGAAPGLAGPGRPDGIELQGRWVGGPASIDAATLRTFQLNLRTSGGRFLLETSTDLANWTEIGRIDMDAGEANRFESVATSDNSRFYRVRRLESIEPR